jgi:hypothetical protein
MKKTSLTDVELRQLIYSRIINKGDIPTSEQIAHSAHLSQEAVLDGFARLADARVLALQKSGEILMAMPFSAVPTPFVIDARGRTRYANCAWDALGVPAMLRSDGKIESACGCCGTAMHIAVRRGKVDYEEAILHFAVPVKHWWDNVVYT